jgi:serine/threonine-protein kinase HipA
MTFKAEREAFVWIWLPNETEPVVAGRLEVDNGNILFNYGKSYPCREISDP